MEIKYCNFSRRKSSPKKDHQHNQSRASKARNNNNAQRSNVLDTVNAKANVVLRREDEEEDGGVVRVKILVRKQDLKQMLEVMGNKRILFNNNNSDSSSRIRRQYLTNNNNLLSTSSLEQRINILRKKQLLRAREARPDFSWSPVLQSIPE